MDNKPLGLKWTNEPVCTLGIYISYIEQANNKENVVEKLTISPSNLVYGEAVNHDFPFSASALLQKAIREFHK